MIVSNEQLNAELMACCERAEMVHIRRQGEVCRDLYPEENVTIRSISSGGIALRTREIVQGKLNRAVGCGNGDGIGESEVRELEDFFAESGLLPEIHLGPCASPATLDLLKSRGYEEMGKLTTNWCALDEPRFLRGLDGIYPSASRVRVRQVEPHERQKFVEASIAGFRSNGRSRELLGALAEIATRRADTTLYFAELDNQVAGTAALASIMADKDGAASASASAPPTSPGASLSLAHLYLDSTLPEFRGQGVQRALIIARLKEARSQGLKLATSITRVGDGSARNLERVGLRPGYTTSIVVGSRGR